jgi:hypothetical protein
MGGHQSLDPEFDACDIVRFLKGQGMAHPGVGKLSSDQLHNVEYEMRTGIAPGRLARMPGPCEGLIGRLLPRSAHQRCFTRVLVLGHGKGGYRVSVSSMSGEVACMCRPRAGYRSVTFCFINHAMVRYDQ